MRPVLALTLFLAAGLAVGQPPIPPAADRSSAARTGDTVTVADGKFADVKVDVPNGASVVWRFYPPPLQRAADLPPGRAIFAGERGKTYVVTAVVIDFGKKTVTDVEFEVRFAGKARPDDDKKDDPPPPDPPGPVTSFRAMIVYESSHTHSAAQKAVMEGKVVEDWLTANCTGGKSGWGRRDWSTDPATDTTPLRDLWAAEKGNVKVVPCVVVEVNGKAKIEQLAATPADMVKVLAKYREGR